MKTQTVHRPKEDEDHRFDFYFEQFSEPKDKPIITVYVGENCYESLNAYDPGDQIKMMIRDANWLLQAAAWLKKEYKK